MSKIINKPYNATLIRSSYIVGYEDGKEDAINDFQEWLKDHIVSLDSKTQDILVVKGNKWELAINVYKKELKDSEVD